MIKKNEIKKKVTKKNVPTKKGTKKVVSKKGLKKKNIQNNKKIFKIIKYIVIILNIIIIVSFLIFIIMYLIKTSLTFSFGQFLPQNNTVFFVETKNIQTLDNAFEKMHNFIDEDSIFFFDDNLINQLKLDFQNQSFHMAFWAYNNNDKYIYSLFFRLPNDKKIDITTFYKFNFHIRQNNDFMVLTTDDYVFDIIDLEKNGDLSQIIHKTTNNGINLYFNMGLFAEWLKMHINTMYKSYDIIYILKPLIDNISAVNLFIDIHTDIEYKLNISLIDNIIQDEYKLGYIKNTKILDDDVMFHISGKKLFNFIYGIYDFLGTQAQYNNDFMTLYQTKIIFDQILNEYVSPNIDIDTIYTYDITDYAVNITSSGGLLLYGNVSTEEYKFEKFLSQSLQLFKNRSKLLYNIKEREFELPDGTIAKELYLEPLSLKMEDIKNGQIIISDIADVMIGYRFNNNELIVFTDFDTMQQEFLSKRIRGNCDLYLQLQNFENCLRFEDKLIVVDGQKIR